MARHNALGKWGEQLAVDKLISEGWQIVERNWRMGHLEIDIIARRDGVVVFAEVKTRSDCDTDPFEAVTKAKISHMTRAAETYMRHTDMRFQPQFDLFAINGTPDGEYTIEHIPDAFYAPLKTY